MSTSLVQHTGLLFSATLVFLAPLTGGYNAASHTPTLPAVNAPASVLACEEQALSYEMLWVDQFGTSLDDQAWNLVVNDATGQAIAAGTTKGDLVHTNAGSDDVWYGDWAIDDGQNVWLEQFGTDQIDHPYDMDEVVQGKAGVDSVNYLAGQSGSSSGFSWLRTFNPLGELASPPLDTIPVENRIRHTPYTFDVVSDVGAAIGGIRVDQGASQFGGWVRRYAAGGTALWTKQLPNTRAVADLILMVDGTIIATGWTGTGTGSDAWVLKLDSDGDELWRTDIASDKKDEGVAVAVDSDGVIYVLGKTFGNVAAANAGNSTDDVWLAKFDEQGKRIDAIQFGTANADTPTNMILDPDTHSLLLTGDTGADLAGDYQGYGDIWMAEFDGNLNLLGCWQGGTSALDAATDIALDVTGDIYLTGHVRAAWPDEDYAGGWDAYVLKLRGTVAGPAADIFLEALGPGWSVNGVPIIAGEKVNVGLGDLVGFTCPLAQAAGTESCEPAPVRWRVECGNELQFYLVLLLLHSSIAFPDKDIAELIVMLLAEGPQVCTASSFSMTTESPMLRLRLLEGAISFTIPDNDLDVQVEASTATITSGDSRAFGVGQSDDGSVAAAVAFHGSLDVTPANTQLDPVTLQTGQAISVTADAVGPIIELQPIYLPMIVH